MAHRNARLTPYARRLLVERYLAGWPAPRIAEQLGVSRATVYTWVRRYRAEGWAGLVERTSRPHRCPARTSTEVEDRVLELRRLRRRGPVFLAGKLGLVASTVGRIPARYRVAPLSATDPITGAPLRQRRSSRRYQRSRPGELLHVDLNQLGRIPDGGGWRLHGRGATAAHHTQTKAGYDYLHVAVDDHSRAAYIEALPDERDVTCARFLHRAATWFHQRGVRVERVLTDNALAYRRGRTWRQVCVGLGIRRRFIRPRRPWTNGKAERLNRTLLTEFAYARPWTSNTERRAALDTWVRHYNTERAHSAHRRRAPITRLPASTTS